MPTEKGPVGVEMVRDAARRCGGLLADSFQEWHGKEFAERLNSSLVLILAAERAVAVALLVPALRDLLECVYQADAADDTSHLKGEAIDAARNALLNAPSDADLRGLLECAIERGREYGLQLEIGFGTGVEPTIPTYESVLREYIEMSRHVR